MFMWNKHNKVNLRIGQSNLKIVLTLILIGTLITGCVDRTTNITDNIITETNNTNKENISKENWYQYTYTGSQDAENSENARNAVNPYLIELGWMQGLSVVSWREVPNHSIVILIPFRLTNESLNNINQTLGNFSFHPVKLNEVVEVEERPN